MSQWQSREFDEPLQDKQIAQQIQAAYTPLFAAAGRPADMAVFCRYDAMTRKTTYYFSPGASALARKFGATACDKPKKEGHLSLLVGTAAVWEIFYPGA